MYPQVGWKMEDCVHQDYYFILKHVRMSLKKISKVYCASLKYLYQKSLFPF